MLIEKMRNHKKAYSARKRRRWILKLALSGNASKEKVQGGVFAHLKGKSARKHRDLKLAESGNAAKKIP